MSIRRPRRKVKEFTCSDCIYFDTCGDIKRTAACGGKVSEEEDYKRTKEFFRDLQGSCKAKQSERGHLRWTASIADIAWVMNISEKEARIWEQKIIRYGFSERQGGELVVEM